MPADRLGLEDLGWSAHFVAAFDAARAQGDFPGRLLTYNRHVYIVGAGEGTLTAMLPGNLRRAASSPEDLPAVGDWLVLRRTPGGETTLIRGVLPRKSRFLRRAAGLAVTQQVIAANIDTVFLVMGLVGDFSPRRVERYLTMIHESGARPVVLLNKADLVDDAPSRLVEVATVSAGAAVLSISAATGAGLEALDPYLGRGQTVALLGSSGAGKSTLVNRLLGKEAQAVGEVRAFDGRGRHTTTQRETFLLPSGALLIDNPGMRELQLWHAQEALEAVFPEVEEQAARCRFPDCSHEAEPGCQVRAALAEGRLDPARLESYRKQQREIERLAAEEDALAKQRQRRQVKVVMRAYNKAYKRGQ